MGGTMLCVLFFFCHNLCVEIYEKFCYLPSWNVLWMFHFWAPLCYLFLFATAQFFPSTRGADTAAVVYTLCFLCIKGGVGQIIMPNTFSPIVFFNFFGKST